MAEYVQWNSVPSGGSGGDKSEFLKLTSGGTYKIRPVFTPVLFYKYFHKHEGKLRTAICDRPDVCPVRDRHPELKKPSMRYAAYVIDRSDGKVKILEAPQSVFRPIGSTAESTGKNPGSGKDGSDFQIKVKGAGLNTVYEVAWAGNTPLTQEEKLAIKEAVDGDQKKLQKIYKVDTPEEIEQKLFGEPKQEAASNSSFDNSTEASEPIESSPVVESSNDSDWENNF